MAAADASPGAPCTNKATHVFGGVEEHHCFTAMDSVRQIAQCGEAGMLRETFGAGRLPMVAWPCGHGLALRCK